VLAEGGSGKGSRALRYGSLTPWNFILKLKLPKANFDAYKSRKTDIVKT